MGDNYFIYDLISRVKRPVFIEAWMSSNIKLLADCIGYDIPDDPTCDPLMRLASLHAAFPGCGMYLALLNFQKQFSLLEGIWQKAT